MEENRCGGFFGGCDWIIWVIVIIILICCFCPGIFGGGYGYYKN